MFIKVCGIRSHTDAEAAAEAGVDLAGFIFVEGTPRALDPLKAGWIRNLGGLETVGVFRDSDLDLILEIRAHLNLDWIQLHGSEPDGWLDILGQKVIRRVTVPPTGVDRHRVEMLAQKGVLPLVDPGAGDGLPCDWDALALRLKDLEFGLAGGLTPDNVANAIRAVRPALVDVASGVEKTPGVKDHAKIRRFVREAANAAPATS